MTALSLGVMTVGCVDDPLLESTPKGDDANIKEFADGYSLCFDITLDQFGGGMNTRAGEYTSDDAMLEEWESTLDPEEFRVLFFTEDDKFLFESKTRWFAETDAKSGNRAWRVGVPVFGYLSDKYDDNTTENEDDIKNVLDYNWDRITEIMRSQRFKIAVLANRPTKVEVPDLSDWPNGTYEKYPKITWEQIKNEFTDRDINNGPFWNALNSIATDDVIRNDEKYQIDGESPKVKKVFDLHHCQFDPLYLSKSQGTKGNDNDKGEGWYDYIMDTEHGETVEINGNDVPGLPFMGAVSNWFSIKRIREFDEGGDKPRKVRFYRLPIDRVDVSYHKKDIPNGLDEKTVTWETPEVDPHNQFIPMYGIQVFEPLTTWTKGTTYNVSQQSGSQTGEYDYKSIFLLRSVVKLELRIPMFDNQGNYVDIDNTWAQMMLNNYMARCEPMDVSTPTNEIWDNDHVNNCEWKRIRDYGLLYDYKAGVGSSNHTFKQRLSWFYGVWQEKDQWDFKKHGYNKAIPNDYESPRIFNPITQRMQYAMITDCYLPIKVYEADGETLNKKESFHRWVVYCGERNISDLNDLGKSGQDNRGYITGFRIHVTKRDKIGGNKVNNYDKIYYLPILDYTDNTNPIYHKNGTNTPYLTMNLSEDTPYYKFNSISDNWNKQNSTDKSDYGTGYCWDVIKTTKKSHYPFPLLRNHFYRVTVSFGDNPDDINVKVIDSEKRTVGGIVFY